MVARREGVLAATALACHRHRNLYACTVLLFMALLFCRRHLLPEPIAAQLAAPSPA
jgi:hypothetical protein